MNTRTSSIGLLLGLAALAAPREAKAEGTIGLDVHAQALFPGGKALGTLGGAIYGGYAFRLKPLMVEPEASVSVDDAPSLSLLVVRGVVGARLGLSFSVEPSIYAHFGYGVFTPVGSAVRNAEHTFTLDAGLGLDYRPARFFTIGITAGYVGFFGSGFQGTVHGLVGAPRIGFWF